MTIEDGSASKGSGVSDRLPAGTCMVQDRVRQRWIVFSTCFAAFMVVLDTYIVNISLPAIAHTFNASTTIVARVVIVYLLVLTSTIPIFGKMGDRLGLTKVFAAGFIVFTFGSLLCGISSSLTMLIFSRVIQALGGAMLYAVPAAIIPRFLPAGIRGASFGALTTTSALGLTLGAPLGGLLSVHFSWHFIFLINVPVGICAVFLVNRFFPRDQGSHKGAHSFDIPGVVLSFSGLATLLYCLNNGQEMGWTSRPVIILCALSLLLLALFILREKRCSDPLLDLSLFSLRDFTLANGANFLQFMFLAGNAFLLPFYLIIVKGVSADRAGLILLSYSLLLMIVGPLAGKASDRIPPRLLCGAGSLMAALASFFFSQTLSGGGLWQTIVFLMMLGVSFGLFISPNNNRIMSSAPVDEQGTASALMKTLTNLGAAFGVCIFETIFTFHIPDQVMKSGRSLMESHLSPEVLLSGLHASYIAGCVICSLALVCTLFTGDTAKAAKKAKADPG